MKIASLKFSEEEKPSFYDIEIDDEGTIWYLNENDRLHREGGPAIEYANGDKEWYANGKRHREGGPAIEYADGSKEWWVNDKAHRLDGPAVEMANGAKQWYVNNKLIGKSEKGFTQEKFERWKKKHGF